MFKIKCIIVEDEPLAVKILTDYISQVNFLELQKTFKDAFSAADFLRENSTDLLFLDIHLPKLKGITFLKTLPNPPAVIMTTAYHQYAVEGFNLNVTDYLLKPFEFERFLTAINKVKLSLKETHRQINDLKEKEYIFITVQKKKVKILFSDIIYVESQREYVKIVTKKKEFITKLSTNEIEKLLPPNLFKRIHRSFIISLDKIESYTAKTVDVNGISITIGRGYRSVIENL
ncbi:MAG: response regulator transcription factor [Melioribacteraceae bacterium]|nr:MAG: response regulator transcription factor [Melioribacteraceae bacterium]